MELALEHDASLMESLWTGRTGGAKASPGPGHERGGWAVKAESSLVKVPGLGDSAVRSSASSW